MKKISINTFRHIASAGIVAVFLWMALASGSFFEIPISEGPCLEIPITTANYGITVSVKDKLTGESIPNAAVDIRINHLKYPLIRPLTCQSPPAAEVSTVHLITNEEGMVTYTSPSFVYRVDIDNTPIEIEAKKENFNVDRARGKLSPSVSSYHFVLEIINLNDQP